jgi:hypothetical protein
MKNTTWLIGIFALPIACASMPKTGVAPTGERLGFDTGTSKHGYMTTEKVGDVQYRDASGRSTGSAGVYRDKQVVYTKFEWTPKQGSTQLSDEDFFRIAGDGEAADAVHKQVSKGWLISRTGYVLAAVGLGMLAASFPLHKASMTTSGLIFGAAGGITIGVGGRYLDPGNHLFPFSRAKAAADGYNSRLDSR